MLKKSKTKKDSTENKPILPKSLGLFDHVNHIRKVQSPDYFDKLTDGDKKSFGHFMILRFLSMDRSSIEYIADIAKYYDSVPSKNFYQLCISVTTKSNFFFPYIKSKSPKLNKDLVSYVSKKFEVSTSTASEYCKVLMKSNEGVESLMEICRGFGLKESEVEKIMSYE